MKTKIVTICGSMKFQSEMIKIASDLEIKYGWCIIQCVYDINPNTLSKEELNQIKDPGRGGLIKKYFLDWVSTPLMILFGKGFNYNYLNNNLLKI